MHFHDGFVVELVLVVVVVANVAECLGPLLGTSFFLPEPRALATVSTYTDRYTWHEKRESSR